MTTTDPYGAGGKKFRSTGVRVLPADKSKLTDGWFIMHRCDGVARELAMLRTGRFYCVVCGYRTDVTQAEPES